MLGNFLKIDYIVVCFIKPLNSACFLWEMMVLIANRLDLRPAAELLGGWPGSNMFAFISINAVPALKGLKCLILVKYCQSSERERELYMYLPHNAQLFKFATSKVLSQILLRRK